MPWLSTPRSLPILIWKGLPSSPGGSSAPTSAHRHLDAHPCIGRTTDDVQQAALPCIDLAHAQAIGIGVLHGLPDFADHDAWRRVAPLAQPLPPPCRPWSGCSPVLGWSAADCRIRAASDSGNCMSIGPVVSRRAVSAKLRQEANVAVEKQAQVVHAIAQHGQAVNSQPKAKPMYRSGSSPCCAPRWDAPVRNPPPPATGRPGARSGTAMSISALGSVKGKSWGGTAAPGRRSQRTYGRSSVKSDLQVLEAHVLANPQAFALVEHGRMGGVAVHAVGPPGAITRISGMPWPACPHALFLTCCLGMADLHRRWCGAAG
jgi:hypothetical protein